MEQAARADAAAAAREGAAAAREAAVAAREQARAQAEGLRDRMEIMQDVMREGRPGFTPVMTIPRDHGPTPRQEKMLFGGFVIAVLAAVVIFYPLVRAIARRLEGGSRRSDALDGGSAERLQRIEQAVDAMAIEIERISEGQRFTTRLLTARAEAGDPVRR